MNYDPIEVLVRGASLNTSINVVNSRFIRKGRYKIYGKTKNLTIFVGEAAIKRCYGFLAPKGDINCNQLEGTLPENLAKIGV